MNDRDRQADITNLLNVQPDMSDTEAMERWVERAQVELTYYVEALTTRLAAAEERAAELESHLLSMGGYIGSDLFIRADNYAALATENQAMREGLERIAGVGCQYACAELPQHAPCLPCIALASLPPVADERMEPA